MVLAVVTGGLFAVLAYFWPWVVSYPIPDQYAWLIVIDKLPVWAGRALLGAAGLGAMLELWPKAKESHEGEAT